MSQNNGDRAYLWKSVWTLDYTIRCLPSLVLNMLSKLLTCRYLIVLHDGNGKKLWTQCIFKHILTKLLTCRYLTVSGSFHGESLNSGKQMFGSFKLLDCTIPLLPKALDGKWNSTPIWSHPCYMNDKPKPPGNSPNCLPIDRNAPDTPLYQF